MPSWPPAGPASGGAPVSSARDRPKTNAPRNPARRLRLQPLRRRQNGVDVWRTAEDAEVMMSKLAIVLIGCGVFCACNRTTAGTAGQGDGPTAATASGSTGPSAAPNGGPGGAAASPNLPATGNAGATMGGLTATAGGNVQLPVNGAASTMPTGPRRSAAPGTVGTASGTGLSGTPIPGPVGGTIAPHNGVASTSMYLPSLGMSITVPAASSAASSASPTSTTNPAAGLGPNVPGLNGTNGANGFAPTGTASPRRP